MKSYSKIIKSSFGKNVLIIAGGTAFAQVLNGVLSPVITRIYSPEDYGIMTVYTAILGMFTIVGSLKYEWGIPIADSDEKAINVLTLSIIVLSLITGSITLLLFFFGKPILELFNGEILLKYKYFIPLGVFLVGLYTILTQWAFRKKNYKVLSKTKFSQSIIQNATKIGLGLMSFGPVGLILGSIFGESGGIATLSKPLIKQDRKLLRCINRKELLWCAKRYVRFPLFSAPSQLLNTAGIQLPVLFLTSLFGSKVTGFYGLANSVVNLPMNLVGRSVADVFYAEAASVGKDDPERLKNLSLKLFNRLMIVGLIPLSVLIFFGPFLFSFVFGQGWHEAGVYARIVAPLVFCRLIFTPISRIFFVFEKQKEAFFLDSLRVALVLVVFGVSNLLSLNAYCSVGLYTIAMSIVYLITFLLAQKIMNDEIKKKEDNELYCKVKRC